MPAPTEAICQEAIWKNGEVMTFASELVSRALEQLKVGATNFTTDIVPDAKRGSGTGIPGSVVSMLEAAHVIDPVGETVNKVWYALRIKSGRPGTKARYLGVYRLRDRALAQKFLDRSGGLASAAIQTTKETQPNIL